MTGNAPPSRVTRWLRDLVRTGRWHRRLLASGLLAGAMAAGLQALEPQPPPSIAVVTAARDLASGTRLAPADLATVRLSPSSVPDGALTVPAAAVSRTLVSAARRGEPLTDLRLVGAGPRTPSGEDDQVHVPVRIADAAAAALLRPGDVVDVLGASPAMDGTGGTPARLLASAVHVVTVPATDSGSGLRGLGGEDGALVLLATTSTTATRLAGAAVTDRLSLVLRGR